MPDFQTFLNQARTDELWNNVEWLLFYVAPVVLIFIALMSLDHLVDVIRGAFSKAKKDNNDDDDLDIYRY